MPWGGDSHEQLQALFPTADAAPVLPAMLPDLQHTFDFSRERVVTELRLAPRYSGGGVEGMTYQHLRSVWDHADEEGRDDICKLFSLLANNKLPHMESLTNCKLVALQKPSGSLRPIAIGTVLERITGRCVLGEIKKELAGILKPHQMGICIPGGSQIVAHAVSAALADGDQRLLNASMDVENAYGTSNPTMAFQDVANLCPKLLPFKQCLF